MLYWLSGLTCTDENFMQKSGIQRIAIVAPDTSPRGEQVADDEGYDLGQGAGFYVNAAQVPIVYSPVYRCLGIIINLLMPDDLLL